MPTAAASAREILTGLHDVMARRGSAQVKLDRVVDLIVVRPHRHERPARAQALGVVGRVVARDALALQLLGRLVDAHA